MKRLGSVLLFSFMLFTMTVTFAGEPVYSGSLVRCICNVFPSDNVGDPVLCEIESFGTAKTNRSFMLAGRVADRVHGKIRLNFDRVIDGDRELSVDIKVTAVGKHSVANGEINEKWLKRGETEVMVRLMDDVMLPEGTLIEPQPDLPAESPGPPTFHYDHKRNVYVYKKSRVNKRTM